MIENVETQTNAKSKNSYVQKINKQRNQKYQTRKNVYRV